LVESYFVSVVEGHVNSTMTGAHEMCWMTLRIEGRASDGWTRAVFVI
jgi:hypothetical protein